MGKSTGHASLTTRVCSAECTEKGWVWKVTHPAIGALLQQHGWERPRNHLEARGHTGLQYAVRLNKVEGENQLPKAVFLCAVVHAHLPTHLIREEFCGIELCFCDLSQQLNTDTVSCEQQILTPPLFSSSLWRF